MAKKKLLIALVVAMAAISQEATPLVQEQQEGEAMPYQNPHDVKACSMVMRPGAVQCKCAKMVGDIQQAYIEACYQNNGDTVGLKKCLSKTPDHCVIIATEHRHYGEWEKYMGANGELRCGTRCKPNRCKCPDYACASHEEWDYYEDKPHVQPAKAPPQPAPKKKGRSQK